MTVDIVRNRWHCTKPLKLFKTPFRNPRWVFPKVGTCCRNTMVNTCFTCSLFLFPCSLRIVPSHLGECDSRQKRYTRKKEKHSMATCSKGSIGALLAPSFCERINSCGNHVVTLGNTLLGDGEMENLVMCPMKRDFIVFMRKHYPLVTNEQFEFGTILTVEDNEEDEDE